MKKSKNYHRYNRVYGNGLLVEKYECKRGKAMRDQDYFLGKKKIKTGNARFL